MAEGKPLSLDTFYGLDFRISFGSRLCLVRLSFTGIKFGD